MLRNAPTVWSETDLGLKLDALSLYLITSKSEHQGKVFHTKKTARVQMREVRAQGGKREGRAASGVRSVHLPTEKFSATLVTE